MTLPEQIVEALLHGQNDISTPHVHAVLDLASARSTARLILDVSPADEKVLLSELGDIAKTVYDEMSRRYASHSWVRAAQGRIKIMSNDENAVETVVSEWRDMGFIGEPLSAYNHIYPITLKKAEPEILPQSKRWSPAPKLNTSRGSMAGTLNRMRYGGG